MNVILGSAKKVETFVGKNVLTVLDKPLVTSLIGFLVIVNIVSYMENLPIKAKEIIKHPAYRSIVTFLSLYIGTKDLYISIGSTIAIVVGMWFLEKMKMEGFELIHPSFDTHPGCNDIKVVDLVDFFKGDVNSLKKAMYSSNVPLNLELTDYDAPLIATYLVQNRMYPIIKGTCGKI
jgi:hypothetical protein